MPNDQPVDTNTDAPAEVLPPHDDDVPSSSEDDPSEAGQPPTARKFVFKL